MVVVVKSKIFGKKLAVFRLLNWSKSRRRMAS